jgi:hypothetical protein
MRRDFFSTGSCSISIDSLVMPHLAAGARNFYDTQAPAQMKVL